MTYEDMCRIADEVIAACGTLKGARGTIVGAIAEGHRAGVAEGERRGREAAAAIIRCDSCDPSFGCFRGTSNCYKRPSVAPNLLAALQWFHDEVSAVLARESGLGRRLMHLRPILDLRADPRYEPIRAARKEGA